MITTPCTNCGFIPGQHIPGNASPDLHNLRRRLSTLDALITALTAERQKLQVVSDAVVYPILSLPTDITAEIFLHYCNSVSSPWWAWHPLRGPLGPLLLSQICHKWREITIHTPTLWRFLDVGGRSSVELLQLWLARSGNVPLDLTLHGWGVQSQPLIAASILHTHHWQDVKLLLAFDSHTDLDLGSAPLPILRSVSLRINPAPPDNPLVPGVVTLNAPMLREAHLRMPPGIKVDLPFAQITTLSLTDIDLTECISTLRGCPDLVKLSVSTNGPGPLHTEPILLYALESLECTLGNVSILEHLTLPCLHALVLTSVEPQNALVLKNCIRRSACPLRVFSIRCNQLGVDTLTTYLAAVSDSVSDLKLEAAQAPLIPALTPMNILPHLKILRIQDTLPSADYECFIDLLQGRLRPSPPRVALAEFRLHYHDMSRFCMNPLSRMPTASTIDQFRALVADGLKVKLTMSGRKWVPHSTHVLLESLHDGSIPSARGSWVEG